jgi:glucose dehydrogenase
LDAKSGKPLWRFEGGGGARTNPISYLSNGKQYVAMSIGNSLFVFGLGD